MEKKDLKEQYKAKSAVGGVYAIRNTHSQKLLLDSTADIQGMKNRFAFAQKFGSGLNLRLQSDWTTLGGDSFVFEVLEELRQNETQTSAEFKADLALLKKMWQEKLSGHQFYR